MKFPKWPFSQREQAPKVVFAPARFIRTDAMERDALRLRSPSCRVGRSAGNDLRFDNDTVSGHHAEIYHLPDGTFQICDLDSTNGTWVNGQRIRAVLLKNGDVVELGEVRLYFRIEKN